jgi:hypothetical protein
MAHLPEVVSAADLSFEMPALIEPALPARHQALARSDNTPCN